jgi:hypothetical protein
LAALAFWRIHFLRDYVRTLKKIAIHMQAMREGPAIHYFADVMGRVSQVPQAMGGSCVQCGNCCMTGQCAFLEPVATGRYQCGIYHSPLRRFSNCGSFPLSQHDIDRYACPSYFAVPVREPVMATRNLADVQAVLKATFGGTPINEQNLTNWRQGGFARWQQHREVMEFVRTLAEESDGLGDAAGKISLADRLAEHVAVALAQQLRAAEALPDGPEKTRTVMEVSRELARLRWSNQGHQRLRMTTEDREAEQEKTREEAMKALVEEDMREVEHETLEKMATIRKEFNDIQAAKNVAKAKAMPLPKELEEILASRDEFERDAAKWKAEAERAAWLRTLQRRQTLQSMRQTYLAMPELGMKPSPDMELMACLPEAERHRELRRMAKEADGGTAEVNPGESSPIKVNQGGGKEGARSSVGGRNQETGDKSRDSRDRSQGTTPHGPRAHTHLKSGVTT